MLTMFIMMCMSYVAKVHANVVIPPPPSVAAEGFVLMDNETGQVIAEKNADMQLPPASLTKMMTTYVIGKELEAGNISMDDEVTISENAWAKNFPESSKMFIEVGTQVKVADLVRGIIIQSGNDACVAMAEHIAGSESAFASMMNAHAQALGMSSSHFVNSHGLHDPDHYVTPRDMALLSQALVAETPEIYAIYSEKEYTYNGIKQYNRNSLLWDQSLNVDGIKTGHTSDAGYSLITSAKQGDMRLISVVMGTDSERARKEENKKLLRYGFRFYETVTPYKAGESFVAHRIYMGDRETVDLGINQSTPITIPRGQAGNLEASFELDKKLEAPLAKGQVVGTLYLQLDGEDVANYPLVALQEVNEGGFFDRMVDYVMLQLGWDE
ncbi:MULTISPECIES: D-alanyl-D-alanine carboxypeptidase family protein [unclassified Alteromonas]|uniref:D-alanyl-D-alanine carboxypeptidase family protein n=1 Tax=unclassified Alteromonas TaxID=2614992 RepID=UPI001E508647|nr:MULTISPECIES: D-alanyl-D-alanine carboxypeptidase family protein [unclassified Alteromonas]MDO6476319.1 D-alanyl-D-alanine carboxypeptidase family protein [Alteromonas sp. 1_MG-2023]MEC7690074.1 D-alanyl-D-alanine carboxypeptidase family protein [Pseudomonadota bacterium]